MRVKRIHAGAYEVRLTRLTFTITSDVNDAGKLQWYVREGRYPGGFAFDQADTLRNAKQLCQEPEIDAR